MSSSRRLPSSCDAANGSPAPQDAPPSLFEATPSREQKTLPEEKGEELEQERPAKVSRPKRTIKKSQQTRYLVEGETRLDATTAQLVSRLSGLRWPRKWSAIRRYDMLAAQEVQSISRWEESQKAGMLARRRQGENVELSRRAEEALVSREGKRGFRRTIEEESGAKREYFIKHLTTSDGFIEVRLSWFGSAWPLFEEASAFIESGFRAFLARGRGPQRSLFEDLDEEQRKQADAQLRLMESVRDGRIVLDYLLRTFGRDGTNPVKVAAWDLRALLRAEIDPHGLRRVRGCLSALSEIRFEMVLKGADKRARSFGSLVSEVQYVGQGTGDHGDGHFWIHLAPSALGCLAVFGVEKATSLKPSRTIAPAPVGEAEEFDWKKSLTPGERERLNSGFVRSRMTLAAHYDVANDFSRTQGELLRWVERELTQERDAAKHKSTPVTKSDRTPRLYSHVFCPVLPQGRSFLGALGHFHDKPEGGRKLASLARALGLIWPAPRAKAAYEKAVECLLNDLHLVVEEVLGGVVAVCTFQQKTQGKARPKWQTLTQISSEEALHSTFLLFIPPDYQERLIESVERYHHNRFLKGEAPFPIKVRRSDQEVTPEQVESVTAEDSTQRGVAPLAERLKEARRQRGLTQAQMAEVLGVSQSMIAHWEKGQGQGKSRRVGKPISPEATDKIERWLASLYSKP